MAHVQRIDGVIVAVSTSGPIWLDGDPPVLLTDVATLADDDAEVLAFYERVANPVPVEVVRHQALLALLDVGITRAMIEAAIAAIEDAIEREITDIRYQQPRWRQDSEFIAWGRQAFGLSEQQVIDLFVLAATK